MTMRILIDGLGLMGGSLAAALTAAGATVYLHHRRLEVADDAAARGWGHVVAEPAAAEGAQVVVTAVPVSVIGERVRALQQALPQAVITDVGSTKVGICSELQDFVNSGAFVGSHPMCGSHAQGLQHAQADLYRGARVVVCPGPHAAANAAVTSLWQACGASVLWLDPASHDAAVAAASHVPHILAAQAARLLDEAALPLAASGFRDTTRVAAGSPALWTDILRENRAAISSLLATAQADLGDLAQALANDDAAAIMSWLQRAQDQRHRFERR